MPQNINHGSRYNPLQDVLVEIDETILDEIHSHKAKILAATVNGTAVQMTAKYFVPNSFELHRCMMLIDLVERKLTIAGLQEIAVKEIKPSQITDSSLLLITFTFKSHCLNSLDAFAKRITSIITAHIPLPCFTLNDLEDSFN